ncbi:MAG: 5-oxoprolinase (ATP-hydrolyzing) [Enterobacterales bacterium]|jgi:5-oxoprolinase (ATP-hydrolysing)
MQPKPWQFWIDRGGTFTDVIGISEQGDLEVIKLLSENTQQYSDPVIEGIRQILGLNKSQPISTELISHVKMGTTVATNALLEQRGAKVLLLITKGFADLPSIGYQNRPDIFALNIKKPEALYSQCIEIDERISAAGTVLKAMDCSSLKQQLIEAQKEGFDSIAIALMHSYKNSEHELKLEQIVQAVGFENISTSHKLSPLPRLVPRTDTTLIDAYLSPILKRYIQQVEQSLGGSSLQFMQSNGGLTQAEHFSGCNSILSGPAGGVVGMVETAKQHGFERIIGFDMGGTSTDICLYQGSYQQTLDSEIAGIRIRAPMLDIHTVAAGGGSCLSYKDQRFQVGPESAGALPGPASYARGGPLTVTDVQVVLGRIRPDCFPKVFSSTSDQPLDKERVKDAFNQLAEQINSEHSNLWSVEKVAEGFLQIAIANMANAIKHMTTEKGLNAEDFVINCFGGAAGQHVCMVAEQLGVKKILVHPLASLLSAYGMGLADSVIIVQRSISALLSNASLKDIEGAFKSLQEEALSKMYCQGITNATTYCQLSLRYQGSDNCIDVDGDFRTFSNQQLIYKFNELHEELFGFSEQDKSIVIDKITVEARHKPKVVALKKIAESSNNHSDDIIAEQSVYIKGQYQKISFYPWKLLEKAVIYPGPLVIFSPNTTIIVEPDWYAELQSSGAIVLEHRPKTIEDKELDSLKLDPVRLELFSNLYQTIAEQMGNVLARTAHSVNIKERYDFSCAIFDDQGNLIANAPHMPVHLGSMSESIKAVLELATLKDGDVYLINNPYQGGTHLPDLTVVTPVFDNNKRVYLLGCRGHHADVGGIAPGSMPSKSTNIEEEGCLFKCFKLVDQGTFQEAQLLKALLKGKYPVRNPEQNIADLKAQIASNNKGRQEMQKAFKQHGKEVVLKYMQYVQDNAEQILRGVISTLKDGSYTYGMDNGANIIVNIRINALEGTATVDFTGTTKQMNNNFNAPSAICRAAVLYVFRCLINDDIPLNDGCLRPIEIIIPEASMLNPSAPAAVVAGNVETSQVITDALFCALGVIAGSQGTMNNLTFGDNKIQYYETIAGGAGATEDSSGASGVQTHMTNSRITDPEILERRFPVLLTHYGYRPGSGGNGKCRGGDGLIRDIQFLKPMTVNILSGNRLHSPPGLAGGEAGKPGVNQLIKRNKQTIDLTGTCEINVERGDNLRIKTPGGGGFGHSVE